MSDGGGFALFVPGPPVPSGRPRFGRGRAYSDPRDAPAKRRVRAAWAGAGRPRVAGTYHAQISARVPRPRSHRLRGGGLSAAGRRAGPPVGDVDNFAKLVIDALVEVSATSDDRYLLRLVTEKRWCRNGEAAGVAVAIKPATGP